jgi:hypothetical protein
MPCSAYIKRHGQLTAALAAPQVSCVARFFACPPQEEGAAVEEEAPMPPWALLMEVRLPQHLLHYVLLGAAASVYETCGSCNAERRGDIADADAPAVSIPSRVCVGWC